MNESDKQKLVRLETRLEAIEEDIREIKGFTEEMRARWLEQDRTSMAGFNTVNNHLSELQRKMDVGTKIVKWVIGIFGSAAATGIGAWVTSLITK